MGLSAQADQRSARPNQALYKGRDYEMYKLTSNFSLSAILETEDYQVIQPTITDIDYSIENWREGDYWSIQDLWRFRQECEKKLRSLQQ